MGNLKFLIITIVLFGLTLTVLGFVFRDKEVLPEPVERPVPSVNNSATDILKAMPEKVDDSAASEQDKKAVADGNNKFAVDFYNNVKDKEQGNIFYSPYSISTALAMTYEGAEGQTAEEMKKVFYFEPSSLRNGNAAIYNILNKKDKNYSLHTANALWAEKSYVFLDDYFNTMGQYYGGRVVNLDFLTKSEESRQTINKWVEEQTNERIKDLLPQGTVSPATRLVLTNAIYFKGKWDKEFRPENTVPEDFNTGTGTVKAEMMKQTDYFGYAEFEGLQVLEMDYQGRDLSMLIFLPNKTLDSLSLTSESLNNWKSYVRQEEVAVSVPKFKFEKEYSLNQNLIEMGMPTAFSPGEADFSGMDGTKNLFISGVVHKAFVEVNEEGTEAAAATGVTIGITSVPETKTFKADHPFIFIIQEKSTGSILFMGRVENPSA